jgi:hypothetical protein
LELKLAGKQISRPGYCEAGLPQLREVHDLL